MKHLEYLNIWLSWAGHFMLSSSQMVSLGITCLNSNSDCNCFIPNILVIFSLILKSAKNKEREIIKRKHGFHNPVQAYEYSI